MLNDKLLNLIFLNIEKLLLSCMTPQGTEVTLLVSFVFLDVKLSRNRCPAYWD